MKKELEPGDVLVHLGKIGSDFATGHGKMHQKGNADADMDGSHNSGFQTLQLYKVKNPKTDILFSFPISIGLGAWSCYCRF